jgi:surfeit locus 1 family protein
VVVPKVFKKIIAFILICAAFITLISLGLWQVNRLKWKTRILNEIAQYEEIDASTMPLDIKNGDEFEKGFLKGRFVDTGLAPIKIAPRTHDGAVGFHIIRPFKTDDGLYLLVNTGWVSNEWPHFPKIHFEPVTIQGYLRNQEETGVFTPPNRPKDNLWYSINIDQMAKYYDLPFENYILYGQGDYTLPTPFNDMPKPRNKHFQYAVFWFGMAGVLALLLGFSWWRKPRR